MPRPDGRRTDQMRPVKIRPGYVRTADGSCLIELGRTRVICTASLALGVPKFLEDSGRGWITAEYGMLPGSTGRRKERRTDGRMIEIQRLIGRSLRAVADLARLDGLTCTLDCDVLEADGGTRTASITGAYVALASALWSRRKELPTAQWPLVDAAMATSVGIVDGQARLDLEYAEDHVAEVDMNVVMTAGGRFIEVQASGEGHTFAAADMERMLGLARRGCRQLAGLQRKALPKSAPWPA
ncbi:MAG: ribonuclease PH [Planctomycetes bacterium]|nr:ribonuclease PH [Planctomycetota bacterium]